MGIVGNLCMDGIEILFGEKGGWRMTHSVLGGSCNAYVPEAV